MLKQGAVPNRQRIVRYVNVQEQCRFLFSSDHQPAANLRRLGLVNHYHLEQSDHSVPPIYASRGAWFHIPLTRDPLSLGLLPVTPAFRGLVATCVY